MDKFASNVAKIHLPNNPTFNTRAGIYEILCPQHTLAAEDNLEKRCQSRKRDIIQSIFIDNLHLRHDLCAKYIMILVQMVLQIFC